MQCLSLVHVREPVACPPDFPNPSIVPFAVMQEDEARRRLYELGYSEIEELVPIDVHIGSGVPADEIVNLAKNLETDLVIIATHGYKGLMHLVMGSTAEKVVRNAPCPVLVVREEEHEFV
jgi:universal stress protein A